MLEQSSVRAGFRSHATRRRAVAIALVVGSISLPLPGRPPATARKVRGSKAARGESVPNYGVIWEGKLTRSGSRGTSARWPRPGPTAGGTTSPHPTSPGSAGGPPLTRPAGTGSIRPLTRFTERQAEDQGDRVPISLPSAPGAFRLLAFSAGSAAGSAPATPPSTA